MGVVISLDRLAGREGNLNRYVSIVRTAVLCCGLFIFFLFLGLCHLSD